MRIEIGTEAEALASLPETFDLVEGEVELTAAQMEEATQLILAASKQNPGQRFFRIVLDKPA